jgi:multidrug transporter EmrE-like cation transporter
MLSHLTGLILLNSCRPYFRKHVLTTLNTEDFLFINSLFIASVVAIYFLYTYVYRYNTVHRAFSNYKKLTYTQYGSLLVIALFAVFSTLMVLDLDKNYNTPSLNYIIIKSVSIVCLFLTGIVLFSEEYSLKQLVGIFLTTSGLITLSL